MDIEKIKLLADILSTKGLSAIEAGEGENRIRIERELSSVPVQAKSAASPVQAAADNTPPVTAEAAQDIAETDNKPPQSIDFIEVKSPLVGVYYAAPSPDAETFVSIGSKVKKGDVLCIIETMKLMNEITAEHDGEIIDICIKNGDIAEFGQVLFKIH